MFVHHQMQYHLLGNCEMNHHKIYSISTNSCNRLNILVLCLKYFKYSCTSRIHVIVLLFTKWLSLSIHTLSYYMVIRFLYCESFLGFHYIELSAKQTMGNKKFKGILKEAREKKLYTKLSYRKNFFENKGCDILNGGSFSLLEYVLPQRV